MAAVQLLADYGELFFEVSHDIGYVCGLPALHRASASGNSEAVLEQGQRIEVIQVQRFFCGEVRLPSAFRAW